MIVGLDEAAEAGTSLEADADWFAGVGVALVLLIGERRGVRDEGVRGQGEEAG